MATKLAGMGIQPTVHARSRNLIYTYAERIDTGDLGGVAQLFKTHGRICGVENGATGDRLRGGHQGPPDVRHGAPPVRRRHPKSKHHTSNVQLHVDEAVATADGTSYYLVTQATPDLPCR